MEKNTAIPLTLDEIRQHLKEHEQLKERCEEQAKALQWAKELFEAKNKA